MLKAVPTTDNTIDIPRSSELLETKLYARPARANLVARPRMIKLTSATTRTSVSPQNNDFLIIESSSR